MRAPKFSPLPSTPDEYERLGDDGRQLLASGVEMLRDSTVRTVVLSACDGFSRARDWSEDAPDVERNGVVASGLSKRFGQVEALVDVDLELRAGEVVALVGDNGAGKSTFIKAISGVQPADAGATSIDGKRVKLRNAKTPTSAVSRPSTRTSPSATTSTLSRTSSWAGRS